MVLSRPLALCLAQLRWQAGHKQGAPCSQIPHPVIRAETEPTLPPTPPPPPTPPTQPPAHVLLFYLIYGDLWEGGRERGLGERFGKEKNPSLRPTGVSDLGGSEGKERKGWRESEREGRKNEKMLPVPFPKAVLGFPK